MKGYSIIGIVCNTSKGEIVMLFNKEHPWRLALGGWSAFIVVAILHLIFGYNIYSVLGFLTAAIILTIGNVIYVLYKKLESKEETK